MSGPGADFEAALAAVGRRDATIEDQVGAADALGAAVRLAASEVVAAMLRTPAQTDGDTRLYLLFERLGYFGPSAVPALEEVVEGATGDVRAFVVVALVLLGERGHQDELLRLVEPGKPLLHLAAQALTKARHPQAATTFASALRDCALDDWDTLTTLTVSMAELGEPLPADVRKRLQGVQPDWRRQSLLPTDE